MNRHGRPLYASSLNRAPSEQSILDTGGTIDGSNADFDFTLKPNMIVVNGSNYREGHGWSWAGTTATLDFNPPTGSDVYGII